MQYRFGMKQLTLAVVLSMLTVVVFQLVVSPPVAAAPITVRGVFNWVDTRSVNTLGGGTGTHITFGADVVIPNGAAGTTASAETTNLTTGLPVTSPVAFVGTTAIPNQFGGSVADNPDLRGPWTLTFQNGPDTTTATTPSLIGVPAPPFASSVTISGTSQNPTFTWQYPVGSIDDVVINLYDKSRQRPGGSGFDVVLATGVPGTTNSFTVPDALAGGLSLTLGTNYSIAIIGRDLRDPLGPRNNSNTAAISRAFFDFTPLPAGAPLVNLPMVDPMGAYHYNLTVQAGQTVFVDPLVAIGYDYAIGPGDPNFQSVLLPTGIGDSLYDIYFFDTQNQPMLVAHNVAGGTPFDFGGTGVSQFRVLGIETSAGLDPANTTAFITGLTFVSAGSFTGTQTPITSSPNQPPDCDDASANPAELWPPNHQMVPVGILGVTDPDGDPVILTITGITQDEPINGLGDGNTSPDGEGVGTDTAFVRAERTGTRSVPGNGRVYEISFTASDGRGGECQGSVWVCVPHDQRPSRGCIDDGQVYDSTQ